MSDDEHDAELVMPFVVCASNGGPHEDYPFVAGYECGSIDARLGVGKPLHHEQVVRTVNLPQVDLIAMHNGYTMTSEPWEDAPDEWTFIKLDREAKRLTAEEFEEGYAERSGMTIEALRQHRKVVPCHCQARECDGWGSVSLDSDTCGECGHYDFHHAESVPACFCGCVAFTTSRRWPREA